LIVVSVAEPCIFRTTSRKPFTLLRRRLNDWPTPSSITRYRSLKGRSTKIVQFPVGLHSDRSVTTRSSSPGGPRWTVSTKVSVTNLSELSGVFHLNWRFHLSIAAAIADRWAAGNVDMQMPFVLLCWEAASSVQRQRTTPNGRPILFILTPRLSLVPW